MNNMQSACYTCKHKGSVPGSAHSSCKHEAFNEVNADPLANILGILGSVGRGPGLAVRSKDCMVLANAHGIKSGWFNHPLNFDPVWLEYCSGYYPVPLTEKNKDKLLSYVESRDFFRKKIEAMNETNDSRTGKRDNTEA